MRIRRWVARGPRPARRARALAVAVACLGLCVARAARADVSVRAGVSPQHAQVGEPLTLSIEVSGARNVPAPSLAVDGFDVRYAGPLTQMSIVNGAIHSSVQHRYTLMPLREGHFTLGPFRIDYDGKTYSTAALGVDVTGSSQPQASVAPGGAGAAQPSAPNPRALRLEMSVPQQAIYLHQRVPVDVTLYVGAVRAADVQYPTLAAEGFTLEKFPEPARRQQVIDGDTYQVLHFQTALVALRSGSLTLGPATLSLNVLVRRRDPFADDPFFQRFFQGDSFSERRPIELRSAPIALNVLPLPEEGQPPGFSGAVGSFTLQVSAAPTEVTAGDPVTLRMTVTGSGNIGEASPPALTGSGGFRTYATQVDKSGDGAAGQTSVTKSFEQVLIPNDDSTRAIPAVRFSYFDPRSQRYETLQSAPIALVVRPPRSAPRAEVYSGGATPPAARPETLGRDIVYIKDDPGPWSARGRPWYGSLAFLLWQPVPLLSFGVAFWYERRRRRLTGDVRYARFSRAGKEARRGLALAEKDLTRGTPAAFYDATSRTMQEYLAAKLGLPPGAIDSDTIAHRGLPLECVHCIAQFLAASEQARFAPNATKGDMHATLSLARDIVHRLERLRGLAPKSAALVGNDVAPSTSGAALLLLLAALSAVGGTGSAYATEMPPSPRTTFYHANALYKDGQYDAAAAEYEQLLRTGLASGNLYFNLGNAYFKAGEKGKAILNYERARRLIPGDPDLAANLAYAQSLTETAACTPGLWETVVFPLAHRLSTERLLWTTSAAYTALMIALVAFRLWSRRPRWLFHLATLLGVAMLGTGVSLAHRLLTEDGQRHAVVIGRGETPTRFEPADNGTVHYLLKEGAIVRIVAARDHWLEVARCDGRRGWIEHTSIAQL
ncbi:MAG: BatD family protein [Candidatus Binatia bacterium]